MNILVTDNLEQSCIDILRDEGYSVDDIPSPSTEDLLSIISGYDALVVRSATRVTPEVINQGKRLLVIGRAGTGVDNIDVAAATRRGILVMNTPGGNTIAAAELTVSLMLALARKIPQAHMSLKQGKWERKKFTGAEVYEKTIGVVGLGKIGREVATRCQALGMKVIGFDPVLSPDIASRQKIEPVSLDELFRRSDYITIHTPLTSETRGLLGDDAFGRCKRGVRIINCARGGIVDESALLRALESGQVGGAALDVFETEPPGDSPLLGNDAVIATPHLGASTEEAQEKVAVQISHQIIDALNGRGYVGVVNSEAIQLAMREELRPYLALAEKMGSFVAQTIAGKLTSLSVSTFGELPTASRELLKAGVLKGVLTRVVPEPVNIINAPLLASEMGLQVRDDEEADGQSYSNLLRVRYTAGKDERELVGTVFGVASIRFVRIDNFRFEVRPEGNLLIYNNVDKPGMLARVSAILASHKVNIAGVSLGRSAAGAEALAVMNIDSPVQSNAISELQSVEGVSNLRLIDLE